MALPLIPLLLAEQASGSAWSGAGKILRDLVGKDASGKLLVLLYNDFGDDSGLTKKEFYALGAMPELQGELNLVVAGRRQICDEDINRLADLLRPHLRVADPEAATEIASNAIAVASFVLSEQIDLSRYLIAKVEAIQDALDTLGETSGALLDGQALLLAGVERVNERLDTHGPTPADREVVRYVRADWGPDGVRKALARLGGRDGQLLVQLQDTLGEDPDAQSLARLLAEPPVWLVEGPVELQAVIARLAEQFGEWSVASLYWEAAAAVADAPAAWADLLVRAAIAARAGGNSDRYTALTDRARAFQHDAPRLALEEASDLLDPVEQLARLDRIASEDPELRALIHAQKALAYLLQADVGTARSHLEQAQVLAPHLMQLRVVGINIVVQEARIAVSQDRGVEPVVLRSAITSGGEIRSQLIDVRRFEESGRLLMLLCDAYLLSGEISDATALINDVVLAEEISAGTNAEVLAEVALRISDYRLALRLLEGYPDTEGATRQRAAARVHTGASDVVESALAELHDIALGGGPEAELAGLNRLMSCVVKPQLPWDAEVSTIMIQRGHTRMVVGARARQLTAQTRYEAALEVLEPHREALWALEGILHVALERGRLPDIADAAESLLTAGPDQPMIGICGSALFVAGQAARAAQVLIGVARNPGAAAAVRGDAYHSLLLVTANAEGDWARTTQLWDEWAALTPRDGRLSAWYARIAAHL